MLDQPTLISSEPLDELLKEKQHFIIQSIEKSVELKQWDGPEVQIGKIL